jgi:hypothetical protein
MTSRRPATPLGAARATAAALREGKFPIASRVARADVALRETHLPLIYRYSGKLIWKIIDLWRN